MIVNGKDYQMWGALVEQKGAFIGGTLEETQDSYPRLGGNDRAATEITDIRLEPNGSDSAYFSVDGKDFGCGGDVHHLGITAGEEGWLTFAGYGGHTWRIKKPEAVAAAGGG